MVGVPSEDRLLEAIYPALQHLLPVSRAALTLYQPDRDIFRIVAVAGIRPVDSFRVGTEMPRGDSHSGWVFEQGQPLIRHDLASELRFPVERLLLAEGVRSLCVVPVILGGNSIGTLNVGSDQAHQFSAEDAALLGRVAALLALAIGNFQAHQEVAALRRRAETAAERYRTLLEINNAIIPHLSRDALLHAVAEALRRAVPFDRAAFTLYHPDRETFSYLAMEGAMASDHFRAGVEFHRSETVAARVFDEQQPVVRPDLEGEQEYPNDRRLVREGFRSDCVVPLIVGGRSIGTLNVASRTPGRYGPAELTLLQEIGNQVALAVENMQSYGQIAGLTARLEKENVYLREEIRTEHRFDEIVGGSPALRAVLVQVEQVAGTDATVLISGETGTGKELIARAIHAQSRRSARPLVKVNCGAISAGLVESELFGHLKGAFTGAIERRVGRFELADGGTIFLDEVGELPPETQVKLLRVLQEREFEPVGSSRPVGVDVRIIAATNRNLLEAVQAGTFRVDLFFRLNVFPVRLPPLRERRADIPDLALFYLAHFAARVGKRMEAISRGTLDRLVAYDWPGNVRELQNLIERGVVLSRGPVLELEPDPAILLRPAPEPPRGESDVAPERAAAHGFATLQEVERGHILAALERSGGVVDGPRGAARMLSLHPNTLRHRMAKLGIRAPASRRR